MVDWIGALLTVGTKTPLIADWCSARYINRQIASLIFFSNGFKKSLKHIADGHGADADLDEIAMKLRATQNSTNAADTYLANNTTHIAAVLGPNAALRIDTLRHSKMGPQMIREQIAAIVQDRDLSALRAKMVLEDIEQWDQQIRELDTHI